MTFTSVCSLSACDRPLTSDCSVVLPATWHGLWYRGQGDVWCLVGTFATEELAWQVAEYYYGVDSLDFTIAPF